MVLSGFPRAKLQVDKIMTQPVNCTRLLASGVLNQKLLLGIEACCSDMHLVLAAAGDDARPVRAPLDVHQRLRVQVEREQRRVLAADLPAVPDPQAAVGGSCASQCYGLHTFAGNVVQSSA